MLDSPLSVKVEEYRRKVLDGTITTEELREAVRLVRDGRATASEIRTSRAKALPSGDDMLNDLMAE